MSGFGSGDSLCSGTNINNNAACPLWQRFIDHHYAIAVFRWDNAVYFALALILLFSIKYLYWLQLSIQWWMVTLPSEEAMKKDTPDMDPPMLDEQEEEETSSSSASSVSASASVSDDEDCLSYSAAGVGSGADNGPVERRTGAATDATGAVDEEFLARQARWHYVPSIPARKGCCNIDFDDLLVQRDNKAVAIVFASFIFAFGLVMEAVLTDLVYDPVEDVISVLVWSAFGLFFLMLAGTLNQVILLNRFVSFSRLVTHSNFAVAIISAGSYITSGVIVAAAVSGPIYDWVDDILSTILFWVLSQVLLWIYSTIYLLTDGYPMEDEVKRGNAAAGVLYATSMVSVALVMSQAMYVSEELLTFGIWSVLGMIIFTFLRLLSLYVLLPGAAIAEEVVKDQNWGAASLLGGIQIALAFGLGSFLPNTCSKLDQLYILIPDEI